MRRHGLVLLCTLAVSALAATAAQARSTPKIRAQKAHAKAVLAEIDRIGRNLETTVQAYDGAKLQLRAVEGSLHRNEYALHVARQNLRAAKRRLMARLYSLYVNGQPDTLDVIAGAQSISQLISRAESMQALSSQDAALGRQALRFAQAVRRRERRLHRLKGRREATVAKLALRRREIQSALARQKRLLASIHTTIERLQAQEAARERRLAAEAQARLARQIAARQAAQRQAVQRQAAAQRKPPAAAPSSAVGVVQPPVPVPVGSPGIGHPQAAQIALRYLGVPYVWGGASPSGFDCSGLVMYVYAQLGISLPHYTVAQWSATLPISMSEIQPGDLLFFDGLGHVGIYIGNGEFVHAPHTGTVVQISSLTGYWAASLVGARRVP
jgi:cell wall-associated NlpC family hydrolase